MARARQSLVYVGIKGYVIAFDRRGGAEVWRAQLPAKYKSSTSLVNVVRDAEGLFATVAGELFALDPGTGQLLRHDPLKGMGTGLIAVATDLGANSQQLVLAEGDRQARAAAAAASSAAT